MSYTVVLALAAREDLRGLPKLEAKRILMKIKILEVNPFPRGKNPRRLRGKGNGYRLRMGDYRALYMIEGKHVTVFAIGNRKNVYRRIDT